ncbi:NACHT domain-containing NTPase [Microcoleus sp. S28C3]|uniref:NACHT domain-containing NTPase n=1 Tax=Microcoleus sp. S28C3 TaxID=3055414 RepID=UPI002FD588C8
MTLPRDFLMEIGGNYDLSPEQKDVFVIRFSSNKTELEIATELHISNSALTTRMSHVYKKFSINGKGPGKYGRLLNFLTAEYRKCKTSDSPTSHLSEDELNDLVQEVRQNCREMIQDQCGTMRSLTMSQRIDVSDLYTNVNILEKITSHRRREIDELLQDCNSENFDRFGLGQVTETIPGLKAVEKYSKLMVLGKPGSGKTTFLKHLAIQCERGKFQANRVPIFITLKQFAETEGKPSLLEYITQMFSDGDVSADQIAVLLKHGKTLVLLDGLDEVKLEHNSHVINQVLYLSDKFRTNHFVMTCRIAAKDYTFDKFKDVEVADFDDKQIATFARKWFQAKEPAKAEEFIQQLRENNRIRELATNPLLLTLLCLVFEESAQFPGLRSELYEEGVDILLRRWDETRNIEREPIYKNLSLQHKKDLLSQIALTTFERGDYFFKQKQLEQYIFNYIRNLSDAQNGPEALQLDSEAVLKSIEVQHGLLVERAHKIYSFSHLTFQEYFTARKIVINGNSYVSEPQDWQIMIGKITEKPWREVFLLVVEMLPSADCLLFLIKQQIEALLATDEKLQQFLCWVNQKSCSVQLPYKRAAVRAFYFALALAPASKPSPDLDCSLNLAVKLDAYNLEFFEEISEDLELDFCLYATLAQAIDDCIDPDFVTPDVEFDFNLWQSLQQLEAELPDWKDSLSFDKWQAENGQLWTEKFRNLIIKYRNIGHNWQFNDSQKQLLQQYYEANELLIDCLNSGGNVSPEVREEIEETLLLPKYEVKK